MNLAVGKLDIYCALSIMSDDEENCGDVQKIYEQLCEEVSKGIIANERDVLLGRANAIFLGLLEALSRILEDPCYNQR